MTERRIVFPFAAASGATAVDTPWLDKKTTQRRKCGIVLQGKNILLCYCIFPFPMTNLF